jgi:hypothetical protein
VTNLSLEACKNCHPEQWKTFTEVTLKSKAKLEKATATGRSPTFDCLGSAGNGVAPIFLRD